MIYLHQSHCLMNPAGRPKEDIRQNNTRLIRNFIRQARVNCGMRIWGTLPAALG